MKIERYLSQEDAAILSRLAEHMLRMRDVRINFAEQLIELIGTAILLPENVRRDDCVALNSEVVYRDIEMGRVGTVVIVCPQEANDTLARVSILAPLAMALLGRPVGCIAEVRLPFDKLRHVEIVAVTPPGLAAERIAERRFA
ncbi:GreA/GreB family elongation factor [Noviherbaspirillum denitrificans]|uniref:Transcriptional regulator n=1 Tax=Noviherbaspirillum denitrificans TaxID=1968433 RepID=A0A254TH10_9BURK|nr:GreA/GreB family elongation factor [Noviherbaspirillum denitrificans]OWW21437.1 transcriptional regulator [Noviherbaspirillum denitrificans]